MGAPAGSTAGSSQGRLPHNVLQFGRVLRRAGLPIGTGQILDAVRAAAEIDVSRRGDLFWALHAVFVTRSDQRPVFREAFDSFWRDPFGVESALSTLLPKSRIPDAPRKPATSKRVREAWRSEGRDARSRTGGREREDRLETDVVMTYSAQDRLRTRDFEQMSADEIEQARALIAQMRLPFPDVVRRRLEPGRSGRVDMRRTLKASLRGGGHTIPLRWRRPVKSPPPIVVLCDISGSMDRYARMLLHFVHALSSDRHRVQTFLFGTRLWYVTRAMRHRDVDQTMAGLGRDVTDWSGGTRIGTCLREFNRFWSRRVLGQGGVVLLVTDGLDREGGGGLEQEIDRLHRSCRQLVWLNPLLRYEGFQPRAAGIRAMLPHVDLHLPVHNLESMSNLIDTLEGRRPGERGHVVSRSTAPQALRTWSVADGAL